MDSYQKRVLEEREALCIKVEALEKFLQSGKIEVKVNALTLLENQLSVMREYLKILDLRIEDFNILSLD